MREALRDSEAPTPVVPAVPLRDRLESVRASPPSVRANRTSQPRAVAFQPLPRAAPELRRSSGPARPISLPSLAPSRARCHACRTETERAARQRTAILSAGGTGGPRSGAGGKKGAAVCAGKEWSRRTVRPGLDRPTHPARTKRLGPTRLGLGPLAASCSARAGPQDPSGPGRRPKAAAAGRLRA